MTAASINSLALVRELGQREENCGGHGRFVSRGRLLGSRQIWTVCPGCSEDQRRKEAQERQAMAAAAKSAKLEAMLRQTAIPQRFIGRNFANWSSTNEGQELAVRIAKEYAANFDSHLANGFSLIFSGAAGTGKSHLAAAILQAILPQHVGVYMTFMGMIRLIRETWHPDSPRRESEVLAELGSVPLLVLDEIGVQYGTEAEHTLLFEVMDRRYRDQKPTILLTNQNKDGFKRFVGDRVYDRMTECARWVTFDWASYRPQARKEFSSAGGTIRTEGVAHESPAHH